MISQGKFIFIFDGFDEVSVEIRERIQEQILDLCHKHSSNIIVVSGRPDDRFDGWQEFTTYKVNPLLLDQVVTLIEKIDFDLPIKKKFVEALKKGLFRKHQSFLSSPLLATMMLLTFQHYAEIPVKVHVFYDLAFATLFSKHDALKEAFKRERYTKLSIDVFKRQLSALCIITYRDEKLSFNESELLEYIEKSNRLNDVRVDSQAFMRDLMESVCILQQDGIEISFSHRSFQEYFAAVYLGNMSTDKLRLLLPQLTFRDTDAVIVMLNDMNHDLFEEAYVIPMIKKAKKINRNLRNNPSAVDIAFGYKIAIVCIYFGKPPSLRFHTSGSRRNDIWKFRNLTLTLYPNYYSELYERMSKYLAADLKISSHRLSEVATRLLRNNPRIVVGDAEREDEGEEGNVGEFDILKGLFANSGLSAWMLDSERGFSDLIDALPKLYRERSRSMKTILDV
jgi:hypothetical protein